MPHPNGIGKKFSKKTIPLIFYNPAPPFSPDPGFPSYEQGSPKSDKNGIDAE